MKTSYLIIVISLLLFGCKNKSNSINAHKSQISDNRNQINSGFNYIKTYSNINQIPEFKDFNLIHTEKLDSLNGCFYGIMELVNNNNFYKQSYFGYKILFVRYMDKKDFQVLDTLSIKCQKEKLKGYLNESIAISVCKNKNKSDREIIGLFTVGQGKDSVQLTRAWKADRLKRKIIEINKNEIANIIYYCEP